MDFSQASPWSATGAGGGSGAVATKAAITGSQHFVSSISGHVDADSIITIKSASTVIWESKIDVSVEGFSFSFSVNNVASTPGAAVTGNIASSSSDCQVNISGFTI